MNPNGVELIRVYTRELGGHVADYTPHVPATGGQFEVVVEAESGTTQATNGASWEIHIVAFDLTTGNNPGAVFAKANIGVFAGGAWPAGWGAHQETFTITVPAAVAAGLQNHLLRYYAYLKTPSPGIPHQVSFGESPLFIITGTD